MGKMLKNRFCVLFVPLLFLSSCISTYDLMESHATDIERFSISDLNGNYANSGDDNYNTLWNTLTNFKSSKKDTVDIPEKAVINLRFESEGELVMTVLEKDRILKEVVVKGKMKGDYFSIKRKLFLIPVPLFFIQHETKVVLGQGQSGGLIVKYANWDGAWVLIFAGGGFRGFHENKYAKLD